VNELGPDQFDIVVPPSSIRAEPPVALVEGNAEAKGTREVAQAYLEYLYSDEAQNIIAKHYYRPSNPSVVDPALLARFGETRLITIDDPLFGGWAQVTPKHFAEGGLFDQLYKPH
jgi:sulfate transport system substrate-binding protein